MVSAEAVEHRRLVGAYLFQPGEHPFAGPGVAEREIDDHETADQEADAVEQVGDRQCAQSAAERVDRTDHADQDDDEVEHSQLGGDAEKRFDSEDAEQPLRAGVEHDRQQNQHVGEEKNQVRDRTGVFVEPQLQILRHRCDAALEEAGQEEERHRHQRHHRDHLPGHHAQPVGEGVAVESDHLLG